MHFRSEFHGLYFPNEIDRQKKKSVTCEDSGACCSSGLPPVFQGGDPRLFHDPSYRIGDPSAQGADQSTFRSLPKSVIEPALVFFTWPFLAAFTPLPMLA